MTTRYWEPWSNRRSGIPCAVNPQTYGRNTSKGGSLSAPRRDPGAAEAALGLPLTQIPQGELASRLLERDPELQAVADALLKARGGAGRPILVEGPAGIGKTRLLQAIGERALLEG